MKKSKVTLVYAAKDEQHNNAAALAQYLQARHSSLSIVHGFMNPALTFHSRTAVSRLLYFKYEHRFSYYRR
jgi:hypothetical protein